MNPVTDVNLSTLYREAVHLYKRLEFDKAADLFKAVAAQGHQRAAVFLGICYFDGKGVNRNRKHAFRCWKQVEEHPYAIYYMGWCYDSGQGVNKNPALAIECYRRAAAKRCARAYRELGYCYLEGRCVNKDKKIAFNQFELAANLGDADSLYWLGLFYKNKKIYKLSSKYFLMAAAKSHLNACFEYGTALILGLGVRNDNELGMKYIHFAAERIHPRAMEKLAQFNVNQ
jgi:uncharacterized protein